MRKRPVPRHKVSWPGAAATEYAAGWITLLPAKRSGRSEVRKSSGLAAKPAANIEAGARRVVRRVFPESVQALRRMTGDAKSDCLSQPRKPGTRSISSQRGESPYF